jgi:hypothetical protein
MAMNQVQFQSGLSMAATRATIAPRHHPDAGGAEQAL